MKVTGITCVWVGLSLTEVPQMPPPPRPQMPPPPPQLKEGERSSVVGAICSHFKVFLGCNKLNSFCVLPSLLFLPPTSISVCDLGFLPVPLLRSNEGRVSLLHYSPLTWFPDRRSFGISNQFYGLSPICLNHSTL